jgi:hypothetical protein
MKKLILVLALVSTSAFAQHHGHHGNDNRWIGPAIIGGIIGYNMRQPQVIVQQQQPVYINSTPVYNLPQVQQGATPLYEKRSQYDFNCNCYVVIYNQIGWQ